MSTSLVGDECFFVSSRLRRGDARFFFLVSARLLASPVSGCCVALLMVSRRGRGVSSVAPSLPHFSCMLSSQPWVVRW